MNKELITHKLPRHQRVIRRYESWAVSGPMQYASGWIYYLQELRPRWVFFGKLIWKDIFSAESEADILRKIEIHQTKVPVGTEQIIYESK